MDLLTKNITFDYLVDRDVSAEVIGVITQILGSSIVGTDKKYKLYKFILDNSKGKKLSVCCWDEETAIRLSSEVQINKIMQISGATVKAAQMTTLKEREGFIPYDIIIKKHTVTQIHGIYLNAEQTDNTEEDNPQEVNFEDLMQTNGKIIVKGYVKTPFQRISSNFNTSTYGFGCITDGTYKASVNISNHFRDIDCDRGVAVIVTGELKKNVPCSIQCVDSTCIVIDKSISTSMSEEELINGVMTPKRKECEANVQSLTKNVTKNKKNSFDDDDNPSTSDYFLKKKTQ